MPEKTKYLLGRGLARATLEKRKSIAAMGGAKISQNRAHMAEIGRKGGLKTSSDLVHMAKIGKRGGSVTQKGYAAKTKE